MLAGHLPELMALLGVALVVFGPKRLPEIGSSLGKGIRGFRTSVGGHDEPTDTHLPDTTPATLHDHATVS